MKRKYSAEEIRDAILKLKAFQEDKKTLLLIEDMLRQAADDMEREKQHEKKCEYALVANGAMYNNHYCDLSSATLTRGAGEKIVRREVGEWEEVTNV